MPDKENNDPLSSLSDVDLLRRSLTVYRNELLKKNKAILPILPRLKSIIEGKIKKYDVDSQDQEQLNVLINNFNKAIKEDMASEKDSVSLETIMTITIVAAICILLFVPGAQLIPVGLLVGYISAHVIAISAPILIASMLTLTATISYGLGKLLKSFFRQESKIQGKALNKFEKLNMYVMKCWILDTKDSELFFYGANIRTSLPNIFFANKEQIHDPKNNVEINMMFNYYMKKLELFLKVKIDGDELPNKLDWTSSRISKVFEAAEAYQPHRGFFWEVVTDLETLNTKNASDIESRDDFKAFKVSLISQKIDNLEERINALPDAMILRIAECKHDIPNDWLSERVKKIKIMDSVFTDVTKNSNPNNSDAETDKETNSDIDISNSPNNEK